MPKKIENPVKEGFISKIYLHTFAEPKTGYQVAKELGYPHVNKIYTIIKEYENLFEVIEKEEGDRTVKLLRARTEPLLSTIKSDLAERQIALTEEEERIIKGFLEKDFREIIKIYCRSVYESFLNIHIFKQIIFYFSYLFL